MDLPRLILKGVNVIKKTFFFYFQKISRRKNISEKRLSKEEKIPTKFWRFGRDFSKSVGTLALVFLFFKSKYGDLVNKINEELRIKIILIILKFFQN